MSAHCTIIPIHGVWSPSSFSTDKKEHVEAVVVAQREKADALTLAAPTIITGFTREPVSKTSTIPTRVLLPEPIRCTPIHCGCDEKLLSIAPGRTCSWQHDESTSPQEPQTLSRQLFFYGFLFFPFWFVGASFLLARPNVEHMVDMTLSEREHIHVIEREWSWRCFEACAGLLLMIMFFAGFYASISS